MSEHKSEKYILGEKRARQAYKLSLEGHNLASIQKELDMSKSGAYDALRRGRKMIDPDAKEFLKEATLAAMQTRLGELEKLVKECTNIKEKILVFAEYRQYMRSIRQLIGIDEPDKVDVTTKGEPIVSFDNEEFNQLLYTPDVSLETLTELGSDIDESE